MTRIISILAIMLSLLQSSVIADESPAPDLSGNWSGALDISAIKLRLGLRIVRTNDLLSGAVDSLDQGVKGIPISTIEFQKPTVKIELKSIDSVFDGTLNKDGSEIAGQWKQAGQTFPLVFKRVENPAELNRPQEPKKPYPYHEELVTCQNSKAGVKLAGTLTFPSRGGHFPAVVLITGSGVHDRNESLMGHQPFLVLADFLTRQGIAVLRCDDRGFGESTGSKVNSTDEDLADDVVAEVAWLKQRSEIDPTHIGLIGHSEGGLIAPLAATRSTDISFIVLMAGPGVPLDQLMQTQAAAIAHANGMSDELIARQRQFQDSVFDIVKHQPDNELARKSLAELSDEMFKQSTPEDRKKLGLSAPGDTTQFNSMLTPWFRWLIADDPSLALTKTHCAVLAINGEKDLQVSSKDNLSAIAAALKAGGNPHFKAVELPGLNHLFQTCKTGLPAEYGEIEETISPTALNLVADWIHTEVQSNPKGLSPSKQSP